MILAVSRYRMEHEEERPALETRPDRDRLMSQAPGFLGIETFRCGEDTTKLLLMTRWSDEASFHQWLSSDMRRFWHLHSLPGLAIDPDLPDPVVLARLEQALVNLLGNAVKFTPERGESRSGWRPRIPGSVSASRTPDRGSIPTSSRRCSSPSGKARSQAREAPVSGSG